MNSSRGNGSLGLGVVLGCIVAVLVAGCEDPNERPEAQRYETLADLRDAAVDAGLECEGWGKTGSPPSMGLGPGLEVNSCGDGSLLTLYASEAEVRDGLEYIRGVADAYGFVEDVLAGPNWTISTPEARRLSAGLGGTVHTSQELGSIPTDLSADLTTRETWTVLTDAICEPGTVHEGEASTEGGVFSQCSGKVDGIPTILEVFEARNTASIDATRCPAGSHLTLIRGDNWLAITTTGTAPLLLRLGGTFVPCVD